MKTLFFQKKYSSLFFTVLFFAAGSCKEKEAIKPVEPDTEKPLIMPVLPAPGSGAVWLSSSDSLLVEGTVTDNVKVHELHVELINMTTGFEAEHVHIHADARSLPYSKHFLLKNITDTTNFTLSVGAEDVEGNYSEVLRTITVTP